MTDKESIQKLTEKALYLVPLHVKRIILWELLRDAVTEDEEGVKWLHKQLEAFVKDEFDDI